MFRNIPFDRINWFTSSFLIVTFFATLFGLPLYFYFFGWHLVDLILFSSFFFLTGMSITLGYHRLFAHRSFKANRGVRLFTLIFGAAAFEDSALDWASDHRDHHKHVDHEDDDPYCISRGFFWAHIGWIFFKLYPRELKNVNDLRRDPLVMWQHKYHRVIGLVAGVALPTLIGAACGGWIGALGGFLFGGLARVVAVQHCTFFINSLCHTVGSRRYDTQTSARDSLLMALFTFGEGYHNYHHTFQHDYRNGIRAWHFDPTKWVIWLLSKCGWVEGLRRVDPEKIALAEVRQLQQDSEDALGRSQHH
ncbi:MAG: fatty acid desaturase, partial [Verrucomicrobiota bacterium]